MLTRKTHSPPSKDPSFLLIKEINYHLFCKLCVMNEAISTSLIPNSYLYQKSTNMFSTNWHIEGGGWNRNTVIITNRWPSHFAYISCWHKKYNVCKWDLAQTLLGTAQILRDVIWTNTYYLLFKLIKIPQNNTWISITLNSIHYWVNNSFLL